MSDKVQDALDHASSLRFPENVLADEVRRLTAALSEAQRERDALRREKADLLDTKPRRDRMFDAEAWDGAMDALGRMAAERDALKGEVERLSTVSGASPQMLWEMNRYRNEREDWRTRAEAAERRLSLAERVVEELEDMASQHGCDCGHPACKRCAMARSARAAVAEYRKAVGK